MKNSLWIIIVVVTLFIGILLGYSIAGYYVDAGDDDDDDARIDHSSRYSYSIPSSYKRMS